MTPPPWMRPSTSAPTGPSLAPIPVGARRATARAGGREPGSETGRRPAPVAAGTDASALSAGTDRRGRGRAGVPAAVLAGCGARLLVPRPEPHDIVDSVLDVVRAHDGRRRLIAVPDGVAVMALALYEELHDRLRPRRPGGPALIELPHAEELAVMVARARHSGRDTAATDAPEDRGDVEAIAPSDDDVRVAACLFDRVAPGGA